jgi:large subunit ribosomal protein L34e
MAKDNRVQKSTRHSYATASNVQQRFKTPGGSVSTRTVTKRVRGPICGDCKVALPGLKCIGVTARNKLAKHERTVSRAYGGSRCAGCVRQRIVRAFLIEEQKIVKKLITDAKKGKKSEDA